MASESIDTAEPQSGTDTGTQTETTTEGNGTGSSGEQSSEPEGSGGEADSSTEVEKWKSLSRKNEKELRAAQSELEKIRTEQMSEQERAVAVARAEGAREATSQANSKLVSAEIRAAAAGVLADPADAIAMIPVEDFLPEGEGDIDSDGIAARVAQLVKEKPYLAATQPKPSPGNVPGGAQDDSPKTFTRTQLRDPEFYEKHEDAILAAARDGRIVDE